MRKRIFREIRIQIDFNLDRKDQLQYNGIKFLRNQRATLKLFLLIFGFNYRYIKDHS